MESGSAKDVFGVRVRSLAFWKMDRVTLRPRVRADADAFYSPEPLVDFFSARSTSPSETPYLAVHFRAVIFLPLDDDYIEEPA